MIDPKSDDLQRLHWLSRIAGNRVTTVQAIVVFLIATSPLCADDKTFDFANDIRPILSDACYHCHGPDANAREADLRLDDRTSALDADLFASGAMLERLTSDDPDIRMPPPDSKRRLRRRDRGKLKQWLEAGAPWPEDDRHWAFIPPVRPDLPQVKHRDWPNNGIDHFVLARLEREGLEVSTEAGKATLLRRVSFDLRDFRRRWRSWTLFSTINQRGLMNAPSIAC